MSFLFLITCPADWFSPSSCLSAGCQVALVLRRLSHEVAEAFFVVLFVHVLLFLSYSFFCVLVSFMSFLVFYFFLASFIRSWPREERAYATKSEGA